MWVWWGGGGRMVWLFYAVWALCWEWGLFVWVGVVGWCGCCGTPRFCAQMMAMIATAPACTAVRLQKTKRNAGAGP